MLRNELQKEMPGRHLPQRNHQVVEMVTAKKTLGKTENRPNSIQKITTK